MASGPQGFEAFFIVWGEPGPYCGVGYAARQLWRPGLRGPIATDVTPVTPLSRQAIIVGIRKRQGRTMLLLTAILRIWLPRDPQPNDLLAGIRSRIGHLGLTVIALVYVLITFWQR
jgi:hypothetical protein